MNINPYGGINFVINEIRKKGIDKLIDKRLGKRVKQATYSYSDIILYWIYCNICGATRLESSKALKNQLQGIPNFMAPSPDRLAGIFKALATSKEIDISKKDIAHEFCFNPKMVDLMLDIAKRLKMFETATLDYDNVVLENEKYDSKWTYSKLKGYQPGVAFIGQTPVYMENRNGNTGAGYKMVEALGSCLENLKSKKIKIKYFRSDAAAFQYEVINLMEENNIDFFIRLKSSAQLHRHIARSAKFKKSTYLGKDIQLAELQFTPFKFYYGKPKPYRVIVKRENNGDYYSDYAIITNNAKMSCDEVLSFYNNRACMERNFDDLKNNFNWKRLPFSFMNENLVFMIMGAISSIIYRYIIREFGKKLPFIKQTFRLKKFISVFILVGSEWISEQLHLYDDLNRGYILLSG